MGSTAAIAGILAVLLVGAMSPGPSFVLVARTAVARSRAAGLAAALGMGVGGTAFAALVLLGLQALLTQVAWLYAAIRLAGAVYLLYLAVRLWRGGADPAAGPGTDPAAARPARGLGRAFALGLATQLSNPKTALYYASVFAALLPAGLSGGQSVLLLALILLVEAGWYALVATAFSARRPRAAYLRAKAWVDRAAAVVLGLIGLRLLAGAVRSG